MVPAFYVGDRVYVLPDIDIVTPGWFYVFGVVTEVEVTPFDERHALGTPGNDQVFVHVLVDANSTRPHMGRDWDRPVLFDANQLAHLPAFTTIEEIHQWLST